VVAITREEILDRLRAVEDPELHRSIVDLGMVKGIDIADGRVRVDVRLTVQGCPLTQRIEREVKEAVGAIAAVGGPEAVDVALGVMTPDELREVSAKVRGAAGGPASGAVPPSPFTSGTLATKVLIVASGKGGVGKSTVAANLGAALAARGRRVGLLDADIYGFSVPRIVGLREGPRVITDGVIIPPEASGMMVMSMGSLVEERQPVIWRGPMLSKVLAQFLGEVQWGEPDYLVVDSPPGTGDVAISLQGQLPKGAVLLVTTPQDVSAAVAARVSAMAARTGQRVLGVVENMSYLVCPHCGERTSVFGGDGGADLARELGVPLLARLPLMPDLARLADEGRPAVLADPTTEAAQAFDTLARAVDALEW
jgi:ATP-binding protein involved in chromosome partitioning